MDEFHSSSVASRIADLHEAIRDPNVKAIFSVVGGFNTNQLLDSINYDLIRANPKIICGFSDITAVTTAITTKTGMITYSGPHFSTWAMELDFEYNLEYFNHCLRENAPYEVLHSKHWSDDAWYMNQMARAYTDDDQYWIIHPGKASGTLVG